MITLKPFHAYRPRPELASRIAALPYDVYSSKEARQQVTREPASFLRIDRAETVLPEGTPPDQPLVYKTAHDLLWKMVEDGELVQDTAPSLYLYELTMDGRSQTGIVGLAAVDDYQNGTIKKHENTRADKEEDRVRHVTACRAHTGPIFLAYRSQPVIRQRVAAVKSALPIFDFTAEDGIRHRGWQISDPETLTALTQAFQDLPNAYIADGHHRAASAVRVALQKRQEHPGYTGEEEFNFFLSVFFPDEELQILDYNRVVKDLNGHTPQQFLEELEQQFQLSLLPKAQGPRQKGVFSMYLEGQWYQLCPKTPPSTTDPVAALDVSLLQDQVLSPLLDIEDPKTSPRIGFVGGIRGLLELERRCKEDMRVAFALYPTSIQELFAVADAGLLMPPKSTWFEPKLRSGLFIHEIE